MKRRSQIVHWGGLARRLAASVGRHKPHGWEDEGSVLTTSLKIFSRTNWSLYVLLCVCMNHVPFFIMLTDWHSWIWILNLNYDFHIFVSWCLHTLYKNINAKLIKWKISNKQRVWVYHSCLTLPQISVTFLWTIGPPSNGKDIGRDIIYLLETCSWNVRNCGTSELVSNN
jgi:hypothetical protein